MFGCIQRILRQRRYAKALARRQRQLDDRAESLHRAKLRDMYAKAKRAADRPRRQTQMVVDPNTHERLKDDFPDATWLMQDWPPSGDTERRTPEPAETFSGHGGAFGGAGASGSWADEPETNAHAILNAQTDHQFELNGRTVGVIHQQNSSEPVSAASANASAELIDQLERIECTPTQTQTFDYSSHNYSADQSSNASHSATDWLNTSTQTTDYSSHDYSADKSSYTEHSHSHDHSSHSTSDWSSSDSSSYDSGGSDSGSGGGND